MTRRSGQAAAATRLALGMVAMFAGVTLVTPLVPAYEQRWDLTHTAATSLFAAYVVGVVLALGLLGRLADTIGAARVVLAALVLADVGALVAVLAVDAWSLLLARVVHGVGVGLVPGATAEALAAAGLTSSAVTVLVSATTTVGIATGLLLGGVLSVLGATWVWLLYLGAIGTLTVLAAAALARGARTSTAQARLTELTRPFVPDRDRRPFVVALVGAALAFAAIGVFAGLGPVLAAPVGAAPVLGASVAALAYVVSGVTQLGIAGHTLGLRPAAVLLLTGAVLLAGGVHASSWALLAVAAVLVGAGNGVAFPAALRVVRGSAPARHRAAAVSTFYLAGYAGLAIPLVGTGLVADATSLPAALQVVALLVAAAALALAVVGSHRPGAHAPS